MDTDDIVEKIYYSDSLSRVTNARVTCNNITVPVDKIESVDVNFRIEEFSFSVLVFLSTFATFLFISFIPADFKLAFIFFEIGLIAASLLWLITVYRNYIELIVTVGGRAVVILGANMKKNDYVCKIASAVGDAIFDERKYQKLKKVVALEPPPAFNSSETIRLKMMIEDYENLKSMKEDLIKAKE
jgi:hypothetical protein